MRITYSYDSNPTILRGEMKSCRSISGNTEKRWWFFPCGCHFSQFLLHSFRAQPTIASALKSVHQVLEIFLVPSWRSSASESKPQFIL